MEFMCTIQNKRTLIQLRIILHINRLEKQIYVHVKTLYAYEFWRAKGPNTTIFLEK